MKKIDKLVLDAFLGPFVITFLVVVFILLNVQMIKYFDDIIGKGLDWLVLGQLFFYFGVITTPTALPLAVLLSALIAYGNLGEHFELTAIKGAGISLLRTVQPIFFFVLLLTGMAFYVNNSLVPKAALEAYSLLYDIKKKKPALDLREGSFYDEIPGISIKVNKKFPDGETLRDIVIYDHRERDGNKEVTKADSGRMFTMLGEHYLKLELFNGYNYTEGANDQSKTVGQKRRGRKQEALSRSKFDKSEVVFDLSSFQLERTDKKLFQGNRVMRNLSELGHDIDSIQREIWDKELTYYQGKPSLFNYYQQDEKVELPPVLKAHQAWRDSVSAAKVEQQRKEAEAKRQEEERAKQEEEEKARAEKDAEQADEATEDNATHNAREKLKKPPIRTPNKGALTQATVEDRTAEDAEASGNDKVIKKPVRKNTPKKTTPKAKKNDKKKTARVPRPKKLTAKDTLDSAAYAALIVKNLDSIYQQPLDLSSAQGALNSVRQVKSKLSNNTNGVERYEHEKIVFRIQWHKIIASSFACVAMFLIGAPLGAIIKKGGLGVPFLVSVLFFIIYYVLTIQGEKLSKQGTVDVIIGAWMPDFILLLIGIFFLRQARADARLFEMDSYRVAFDKLVVWIKKRRKKTLKPA